MSTAQNIEELNGMNKSIIEKTTAYNTVFKDTLESFIAEHHLDKTVIRNETGKEERGELRVFENYANGYKNNRAIPCYLLFYPYRKDGQLSNAHRLDNIVVNVPGDYFNGILERYKPAENK